MITRVVSITDLKKQQDEMREAARLIRLGEVVAFPTETVYGLGADALDAGAVRKIFRAKGRPADNPLIIHIHDTGQWQKLVEEIPDSAYLLAEKFWPGPLTMILNKSGEVPAEVTAGLNTVAVRVPAHPVALSLISLSGVPIAAPSANRSGRPSPTAAQHVLKDMAGRIPLILDGGRTDVGVESTVLDLTKSPPVILRPGGVTVEMLESVIGQVAIHPSVMQPVQKDEAAHSPGMKYVHYAPKAPVVLIRGSLPKQMEYIRTRVSSELEAGKQVGILATDQTIACYDEGIRLSMGDRDKPADLAGNLFARLREFDDLNVDIILAEGVDEKEEGLAVMNRMARAAGFCIIDL
ncbi:MAG: L-threonylcarbamoyladenylate synthase [Caldicoprobacterales bacterium]|jgi:L-threonylcarbamoyladenylate synthase|nr:threonylcarbamoyl-AMP synthase [Clostridiales bacterium]